MGWLSNLPKSDPLPSISLARMLMAEPVTKWGHVGDSTASCMQPTMLKLYWGRRVFWNSSRNMQIVLSSRSDIPLGSQRASFSGIITPFFFRKSANRLMPPAKCLDIFILEIIRSGRSSALSVLRSRMLVSLNLKAAYQRRKFSTYSAEKSHLSITSSRKL